MDSFRPKKSSSAERYLGLNNHFSSSSSSSSLELDEADIFDVDTNPNPNSVPTPFTRSLARPIPRTLAPELVRQHSAPMRVPVGAVVRGEEEEEKKLPPHEIVDRAKMMRGWSASVLEGKGRTLKGRDLINFRNFVLGITGFFK